MFNSFKKKIINFLYGVKSIINLRIDENRVYRQKFVPLSIDGEKIKAPIGEILAVTLFANKKLNLNYSSRIKEPRSFFCLMGSCQECLIMVDEKIVLACQETVKEGINIKIGLKK